MQCPKEDGPGLDDIECFADDAESSDEEVRPPVHESSESEDDT